MVNVRSDASFLRDNGDGSTSRVSAYFHSSPQIVNDAQPIDIPAMLSELNRQIDNWNGRGSGFVLDRILRFVLCISAYRPLVGSTYIPTPKWLANKRCVINVENKKDNKCFVWSVLAGLLKTEYNAFRVCKYVQYERTLNLHDLEFPMPVKLIPRFEKNNGSISINVLYTDTNGRDFSVLYLSPHRQRTHHINLLLLDDPDDPSKHHYTYIKKLSALVAHRTKHTNATHVCNSCLHPFTEQDALNRHIPYCIQHNPQHVQFPDPLDEKDRTLKFRCVQKQHPIPFYLVADFESFLTPVERAEAEKNSGLQVIDEHSVSGFSCYRVTSHAEHQKPPFVYSGCDPMTVFYDHVMSECREISHIVRGYVDMLPLTAEQADDYDRAVSCANCGEPFTKENRKVHHHCHISGSYLFAACNNCNLQLKPVKCNATKKKRKNKREAVYKGVGERNV